METTTNPKFLSPDDYASAIADHARKPVGSSLYPGSNYVNLARYLERPGNDGTTMNPRSENDTASFVSIVTITAMGHEPAKRFKNVDEFKRFHISNAGAASNPPGHSLLFLRGFPSPEWLRTIGSTYSVDPEFFQRHLDFRSTAGKIDFFPLPSLPSSSRNIIRIRLTTIGAWQSSLGQDIGQRELDALRRNCAKSMDEYDHNMRLGRHVRTGDSIVRRFSVINGTNFSIEQEISVCVCWRGSQFTIVIWLDSGSSLNTGPAGPWRENIDGLHTPSTFLYPIIQHEPRMVLKSLDVSNQFKKSQASTSGLFQGTSILDSEYGGLLDAAIMVADPFYALSEIWQYAAYAECQFLNMIETVLGSETGSSVLSQAKPTLANLLYCQQILESHSQRIGDALNCIGNNGGPQWIGNLQDERQEKAIAVVSELQQDYKYLLSRVENMKARCSQGMNVIMNNAVIAESRKAIQQTKEVAKLTRLAFFYIPLSFTASFLGMNVRQFGNGTLPLWIWFAFSIPVFGLSVLVLYMDITKLTGRFLGRVV